MAILQTIDDFKGAVKINATTPINALLPFITDATDKFLLPYLGQAMIDKFDSELDKNNDDDKPYVALLPRVRRVLAPFTLYLGSAELSINFGDSGHTVSRTNTAAPASDSKIDKSDNSLLTRGWQNLELLLDELDKKEDIFQEWKDSKYYKTRQTKFFDSVATFQDCGLLDIDYKRLTFEKLRTLILGIEETEVWKLITSSVYDDVLKVLSEEGKETKRLKLLKCIRAFIGNRVGELHTSQSTRIQRSQNSTLEYKGVIRPLYGDVEQTGNYYAEQSEFWKNEIIELLPEFGVDMSGAALKFNSQDRSIMVDIG